MVKRMVIMLACVGVVFGGLYGFQQFKASIIRKVIAGIANPTLTVSAMPASTTNWQGSTEAIGSLTAVNGADLALQVPGIVQNITFKSGDSVKAGQTLLQLNADNDTAFLAALQATADNDAVTLQRDQALLNKEVDPQTTIDSDAASLKNARALVAQQQALLEEKTLKAPFAGKLGINAVSVGQYLTAGTSVVTLQALDPIYVDFYLPQQMLSQIKVGQAIAATVDTYPGRSFAGTVAAINSKVDPTSRNVQVRAVIKNADNALLPGMFAKVDLSTGAPHQLITLPQTAIVYSSYGDSVFIVGKQGTTQVVHQVFVQIGSTRGDQVAVTSGVKAGDVVVVAGQMKLRNGVPVTIDNSHVPTAEAQPNIADQ